MKASTLTEGYRYDAGTVITGDNMDQILGHLHDVDEKRHYAAVDYPYDLMDRYNTDWHEGVWDKSWARAMPPMVQNHKDDLVIGRAVDAESVRGTDGRVARLVGRFSRTQAGEDAFVQTQDGDWPGWSFHYQQAKSVPHPSVRGARRFVEAHMAEFGPVTFPAIPGANAVGIRSTEEEIEVVSFDTLRSMYFSGELTFEGYRSLVETNYPEMMPFLTDVRATPHIDRTGPAGVVLAPDMGRYPNHEPPKISDGSVRPADQMANQLASLPPGRPALHDILAFHNAGHLDDDGMAALVREHYPHLAARMKRKSSPENVRAVLLETFGEEAVRDMQFDVKTPRHGGAVDPGSHGGDGGAQDDHESKELVSAIVASLDASEAIAKKGEPGQRSEEDWSHMRAYQEVAQVAALTLADMVGADIGDRSASISDEDWDGDAGRFTPEQYRRSCLIDTGEGEEDSKDRYKLPVREPNGTLSRKGVHAAAAALAGARGGVHASDAQKQSAARQLLRHYNELEENAPPSIVKMAGKGGDDDDGGRSAEQMTEEVRDRLDAMEKRGRLRRSEPAA
jgi:hypothetical protein